MNARSRWSTSALVPLLLVASARCSKSSDESGSALYDEGSPQNGSSASTGGTSSVDVDGSGEPVVLPPEEEVESSFRVPVATDHFVWTANPLSGYVALIDARDRSVRTVAAGHGPTYLAALPALDGAATSRAIVINALSQDATLLTTDTTGAPTPERIQDLHAGANAWAISSRGRWAIAWTDAAAISAPDPLEGFQEVSVIDLQAVPPAVHRLNVAYRPTRIFISEDETRAFAVTAPGLSVIELVGTPRVSRDMPVTPGSIDDPAARDVTVTSDGRLALVRREGSSDLYLVSTETGEIVTVPLMAPVTDLDLAGSGERAVAVIRALQQSVTPPPTGGAGGMASTGGVAGTAGSTSSVGGIAGSAGSLPGGSGPGGQGGASGAAPVGGGAGTAPVSGNAGQGGAAGAGPDPVTPPVEYQWSSSYVVVFEPEALFADPTAFDQVEIPGEIVGSVSLSELSSRALLFTTVAAPASQPQSNEHVTILNLEPGAEYLTYRTETLRAPVSAVFVAPDDAHAIALLEPGIGSTRAGAFSAIPVLERRPNRIEGTNAPPRSVALASAPANMGVVTASDVQRGVYETYLVQFPSLQVDRFELQYPPLATGIVPTVAAAYVAQEHHAGRLTFLTFDDAGQSIDYVLTGFELGTGIQR